MYKKKSKLKSLLPYHFGRHKSSAFVNACTSADTKAVLLQTSACVCIHSLKAGALRQLLVKSNPY